MKHFLYAIFIISCINSVTFSYYKFKSLSFHTRDFAYYLQFSSKLFDQKLSSRFSSNPEGHNFLGFYGTDGEKGLHQAIHLEPVKYIDALLFYIFKTPVILFLFRAIIFFMPILYLWKVFPVSSEYDRKFLVSIALICCLYPSFQFAVSFDLRPYALLAPIFFMSFLSIAFNRPKLEAGALFNFMFLAREEALLFGIINILFSIINSYTNSIKSNKHFNIIFPSWMLWFSLTWIYFLHTGYDNIYKINNGLKLSYLNMIDIKLISPLLVVVILLGYLIANKKVFKDYLCVIPFFAAFIPLGFQFYLDSRNSDLNEIFYQLIYGPRWTLNIFCMLLLLIMAWQSICKPLYKARFLPALYIIIAVSLILNFITASSPFYKLKAYFVKKKSAEMIFSFRNLTDKYQSFILCDYQTHQACYDYENVYVYRRLPSYLLQGRERYYPENMETLRKLLAEKIEYIVVSSNEKGKIMNLTEKIRLPHGVRLLSKNKLYFIYQISR